MKHIEGKISSELIPANKIFAAVKWVGCHSNIFEIFFQSGKQSSAKIG